jgi:hypothetical protein
MQRRLWLLAFPLGLLVACGGSSDSSQDALQTARLVVTALAGPVCPVVTDPPAPECAPRPVDGAVIAVTDADGIEVGRAATDPDGKVGFDLVPGEVVVIPQSVEGLPGTAAMFTVMLTAGQTLQVMADYDTGIR